MHFSLFWPEIHTFCHKGWCNSLYKFNFLIFCASFLVLEIYDAYHKPDTIR